MQSLGFDLIVYAPYRALDGFVDVMEVSLQISIFFPPAWFPFRTLISYVQELSEILLPAVVDANVCVYIYVSSSFTVISDDCCSSFRNLSKQMMTNFKR